MNFAISLEERDALLKDARETIAAVLEKRSPVYKRSAKLEEAAASGASALTQPCGAFVTLHKQGQLRGCIGRMTPAEPEQLSEAGLPPQPSELTQPLEKTVRIMAVEAAFRDPRFPPLAAEELDACRIEISALSPMEPCGDPRQVVVGTHGLYLVHRGRSGALLPQVPVEQGWNQQEYLDYICVKAGLPPHSYKQPGAKLFTFTAAVFRELGE
jgi:AMMECR1 domain-containing protein